MIKLNLYASKKISYFLICLFIINNNVPKMKVKNEGSKKQLNANINV